MLTCRFDLRMARLVVLVVARAWGCLSVGCARARAMSDPNDKGAGSLAVE